MCQKWNGQGMGGEEANCQPGNGHSIKYCMMMRCCVKVRSFTVGAEKALPANGKKNVLYRWQLAPAAECAIPQNFLIHLPPLAVNPRPFPILHSWQLCCLLEEGRFVLLGRTNRSAVNLHRGRRGGSCSHRNCWSGRQSQSGCRTFTKIEQLENGEWRFFCIRTIFWEMEWWEWEWQGNAMKIGGQADMDMPNWTKCYSDFLFPLHPSIH
jgi:hypothetical protein